MIYKINHSIKLIFLSEINALNSQFNTMECTRVTNHVWILYYVSNRKSLFLSILEILILLGGLWLFLPNHLHFL